MGSYTHFTLSERKYLQQLLSEGLSFRKIAAILERSPSSISREVKRNRAKYKPHRKTDNKYWYNHWRANTLYITRRRQQNRAALKPDTDQWDYIVAGLRSFWSPEEICGRWHSVFPDRKPLCVSTIYRYIKLGKFPGITDKNISGVVERGFFPEIPITTVFSRIGSSQNGRTRSATGSELETGRATPFMAAPAKACWSPWWTERAGCCVWDCL